MTRRSDKDNGRIHNGVQDLKRTLVIVIVIVNVIHDDRIIVVVRYS